MEPGGVDSSGEATGGACLNCGTALAGAYCHACGQSAHVHRTIGAWWHDLAHGVLHFEGKIWRTLPLLAWKPGELTRRYVEGERARFISPLALFLFSVFLMFAVFSSAGGGTPQVDTDVSAEFAAEIRQGDARIAALQAQLDKVPASDPGREALEAELAQAEREQAAIRTAGGKKPELNILSKTGWARLDHGVEKAEKNPSLLLYKLQSNGYKFSWALILISTPFLWLLLLHRRRYREQYRVYDHLVFVTYSIGFMSLIMVMFVLLRLIGLAPLANLMFVLVPPVHMYRQLRGAYGLTRFGAVWRTAALIVFAAVALMLFLALLLALGLLG
ncbi:MAG TPA: DUF3667 domain-containing protein [Allosphingosinicella sp.]|jgi:hypothetical protein